MDIYRFGWIAGSVVFIIALVGFGDETNTATRLLMLAGIPACLYFAFEDLL